ncbi:hypothetical protein QL989_03685 [Pseudoalteromonas sp. APC 3224]|uniref:hypothetical protein n=1 Tax=Pseudoalteromonas sp. APC 3224 TaxID=3035203 RepID=UPI0025B5DACD|nr:hypothetical protein [Pseudoalteromonas sp. APC 3224]MDN3484443.1 hypothetical protein [Pseudoalteromonas sp. APC 3224]
MCKEKEHLFFSQGPNLLENSSAYWQQLKSQFLAHRYRAGADLQQYFLRINEQVFNYLDYKPGEIAALPFYKKPGAYINQFKCDAVRQLGQLGIQYGGDGAGIVLDKVVGTTVSLLNPTNMARALANPDLAWRYMQQFGTGIEEVYQAIDRQKPISSMFNLAWLSARKAKETGQRLSHRWDNQLHTDASYFRPLQRLEDKSKHFATGVVDVVTDNLAEVVGKVLIGTAIYRTGARKINTFQGVKHWESKKIYRTVFPGHFAHVGRFVLLKPLMRMTRNPGTFVVLTGYYLLSNIGQNIQAHNTLKSSDPELFALLEEYGIDMLGASRNLDLSIALQEAKHRH